MSTPITWRPSASIEMLQRRARCLDQIRNFFAQSGAWEVQTPLLAPCTIPDPNILSIEVPYQDQHHYLQTSPEFHMKRLLAAGSGPIYQISKVFRAHEHGRRHHPEFTMIEWYRPNFSAHDLMQDIAALLAHVADIPPVEYHRYQDIFLQTLSLDPLETDVSECQQCAKDLGLKIPDDLTLDDVLNVLMSHCIEPTLGQQAPVFIHQYPVSQAALAQSDPDDPRVAKRFELYWQGIELANGFQELTDPQEQRRRFVADNQKRQQQGQAVIPIDERLLASLQHMPPCSGVALGFDRLLMVLQQQSHIDDVVAFPLEIA